MNLYEQFVEKGIDDLKKLISSVDPQVVGEVSGDAFTMIGLAPVLNTLASTLLHKDRIDAAMDAGDFERVVLTQQAMLSIVTFIYAAGVMTGRGQKLTPGSYDVGPIDDVKRKAEFLKKLSD